MRDMNPANPQNWVLVCSGCGAQFDDRETIALEGEDSHFAEHPDIENPHFSLTWVGVGPRPKSGPTFHRKGGGRRRRRRR